MSLLVNHQEVVHPCIDAQALVLGTRLLVSGLYLSYEQPPMLLSPFRHLIDNGEEPLAVLRYTVFHPWRIAVALMALYQTVVHHLAQPLRQHPKSG